MKFKDKLTIKSILVEKQNLFVNIISQVRSNIILFINIFETFVNILIKI
jgi:hypothetical protein